MDTDQLWEIMDKLRATRSSNKKCAILKDVYQSYDTESVYWATRFLARNPLEGFEDTMGAKKKTVRKAIEQVYNVPYDEIRELEKEAGNLSDILIDLEPRQGLVSNDIDRSEHEVYELGFDIKKVANSSGNETITVIGNLLSEYENPEVVSFGILGDIALGCSAKTMLKMLTQVSAYPRPELDKAYGIRPDIAKLVGDIHAGEVIRTDLQLFDRIKPMKGRKASLPDDMEHWIGSYKYDGARVLIHVGTGTDPGIGTVDVHQDVRAYTTTQNEVSDALPELDEIEWPHRDFIIDAEAIGFDTETGEHVPFQRFSERFQREKNVAEKAEEIRIEFRAFDLLHLDGDITHYSYAKRLQELELLLQEYPDMLAIVMSDPEECYVEALDAGHEGVIARDINASYVFDRDSSMRKKKPVKDTVDLRVRGVVRGTGNHSDRLGALQLETKDGEYIGRVGTGFTDEDRFGLWEAYQNGGVEGEVVELEFEEFMENGDKYGLRFPRFLTLRPEGTADTLERVKNL